MRSHSDIEGARSTARKTRARALSESQQVMRRDSARGDRVVYQAIFLCRRASQQACRCGGASHCRWYRREPSRKYRLPTHSRRYYCCYSLPATRL